MLLLFTYYNYISRDLINKGICLSFELNSFGCVFLMVSKFLFKIKKALIIGFYISLDGRFDG